MTHGDLASWPRAAQKLAELAKPGDRGLGDVAERLIASMGGNWYKMAFKAIMGHECSCGEKQAKMNAKYPLK